MKEILIDIRETNQWIRREFKNKDVISLQEFLDSYENLLFEKEHLEEENEDLMHQIQNGINDEPDWYQEFEDDRMLGM